MYKTYAAYAKHTFWQKFGFPQKNRLLKKINSVQVIPTNVEETDKCLEKLNLAQRTFATLIERPGLAIIPKIITQNLFSSIILRKFNLYYFFN